jgi:hypothetical protein
MYTTGNMRTQADIDKEIEAGRARQVWESIARDWFNVLANFAEVDAESIENLRLVSDWAGRLGYMLSADVIRVGIKTLYDQLALRQRTTEPAVVEQPPQPVEPLLEPWQLPYPSPAHILQRATKKQLKDYVNREHEIKYNKFGNFGSQYRSKSA